MKMKDYLGIESSSVHYYKNQDIKLKEKTRSKIKHDFNVLMKAGKKKKNIIAMLCRKWLCNRNVVYYSIK